MLSAHAEDARAFVQCTCVLGTINSLPGLETVQHCCWSNLYPTFLAHNHARSGYRCICTQICTFASPRKMYLFREPASYTFCFPRERATIVFHKVRHNGRRRRRRLHSHWVSHVSSGRTGLTNGLAWPVFYWLQLLLFRGAGTSGPQGQQFHVLYAKLLLTHCFMSLSAYPGTEVNRLCVIRK